MMDRKVWYVDVGRMCKADADKFMVKILKAFTNAHTK